MNRVPPRGTPTQPLYARGIPLWHDDGSWDVAAPPPSWLQRVKAMACTVLRFVRKCFGLVG